MFLRHHHIKRGNGPRINQHMWTHEYTTGNTKEKTTKITKVREQMHCGLCQLYEFLVRYWTRALDDTERANQVESRRKKLSERFKSKFDSRCPFTCF